MMLLKKPSILVLIFAVCFSSVFMDLFRTWHLNSHPFTYDVSQYYSYLPAHFYHHGEMKFNNIADTFLVTSPIGKRVPKVTYGLSILYSPFFLLGQKIAINQKDKVDGYSEPYATCIHWGSIFYSILGLFFLRQFLIKYFRELVVAFVMVLVFFGTNLFAYTYCYGEMAHAYLFMLFSALLYLSNSFYERPSTLKFMLLGFLVGLISLIRPIDIIFSITFLLWNVTNMKEFKERLIFYFTNYRTLIAVLIAFLLWVPQFLFWKKNMGSYVYFSYPGEGFFWNDPQIINILFSYRKGWMLYTPMIILAFIGFIFMKLQKHKNWFLCFSVMALIIYVYSCWWDWTFGGGFSGRAFIAYISILAFPLAAFVKWILSSTTNKGISIIKLISFAAAVYFVFLNIGQSYQSTIGLIHYNGMTKKAYKKTFGKYVLYGQDMNDYSNSLKEPDWGGLMSGANRDQ